MTLRSQPISRRSLVGLVGLALALGCATAPRPPAPDESSVFGHLRLVPREGLELTKAGGNTYGDRRLRDVELVDYSRPGFVVVYVDRASVPNAPAEELSIRNTGVVPRLAPSLAAVSMGGELQITNRTDTAHVLSCPEAKVVEKLAPGASLSVAIDRPGEYNVYLLDVPGSHSQVFAAPGRFAVVTDSGRFELTRLSPGPAQLNTWHPRFPPTRRKLELIPGEITELELEIGVGRSSEARDATP